MQTQTINKNKVGNNNSNGKSNGTVSPSMINGNGLAKLVDGEVKQVRKRDGQLMDFDIAKVVNAVYKSMLSTLSLIHI